MEFPNQNDTLYYGETYFFGADAQDSDGSINYFKLFLDEELLWQVSSTTISFQFATELYPQGNHKVEYIVSDNIGATDSKTIEINIRANVPYVSTLEITNVSSNSTTVGGVVLKDGGLNISSRGICYNTSGSPLISDFKVECGTGIGGFFGNLENLEPGTTYYAKAYAVNANGVGYGDELTFTTYGPPTVKTYDATEITENSAKLKGEVVSENGYPVTFRGITWSRYSQYPTPGNYDYVELGEGPGEMSTVLENLPINTTYYYRAFGFNEYDISYGESISFTTSTPSFSFDDIYPVSVTEDKAKVAVVFYSFGTISLTNKGICWNTTGNPTYADNIIEKGEGNESFQIIIDNLTPNTTYYIKGFANTSDKAIYYTDEKQITTLTNSISSQIITDSRDGNKYITVDIGDQSWFAENLNYSYAINDCFNFKDDYCLVYGKYYSEPYNNICPTGWHIPTDDEWRELEMFLGMSLNESSSWGWRGTDEGGKMKSLSGWNPPNTGATNSSGLNIIGGGKMYIYIENYSTGFMDRGKGAFFFVDNVSSGETYRGFGNDNKKIERQTCNTGNDDFWYQMSIRCVKN